MEAIQIHEFARQLMEAQGDKAIVTAAQKARSFEERGKNEEAQDWRRVEAALKIMRGPNQS